MTDRTEELKISEARAELFEAISHPARIRILQVLSKRPMGFTDLGRVVGIEGGGPLSFHLRKLERLVTVSPGGVYGLTGDGKEALRSVNAVRKSNKELGSRGGTDHSHQTRSRNLLAARLSRLHFPSSRAKVYAIIALLLLGGVLLTPRVSGQTSSVFGTLSIDHSILKGNATRADLPAGSQTYLWAMDTGGYRNATSLSTGSNDSLYTAWGWRPLAAQVDESTSNSTSFSTNTHFHSIGGVGVSGFAGETLQSAKAYMPNYSVSITVSTSSPALAVIIALQAGDAFPQDFRLNGPSGMITDQAINTTICLVGGAVGDVKVCRTSDAGVSNGYQPLIMAHAVLQPGAYNFRTSVANGSSDLSYAEMIAVWLFYPHPSTSFLGLTTVELVAIIVVILVLVGGGVFALRRAKKPSPP